MGHGDGSLPTDPVRRLGPWKCHEDVPTEYRLATYADLFKGRDTWREYHEATGAFDAGSERRRRRDQNTVESWNQHMQERGRHPALATPADVEGWSQKLLDGTDRPTAREKGAMQAYQGYWVTVEQFYDWLRWHADLDRYPHRYNPVVMAAAQFPAPSGATGKIWAAKVSRREKSSGTAGRDTDGQTDENTDTDTDTETTE